MSGDQAQQQGSLSTGGGFTGLAGAKPETSIYGALDFMMRQINRGNAHAYLCRVARVTGGGIAAPAVVDVLPLVSMADGLGNLMQHGTVYGLPAWRCAAGNAALVVDPVVNDIGLAVVCDQDISGVKATKDVSGPSSGRENNRADGVYFGAVLSGTPTIYLEINQGNVNIIATGSINIHAGGGTTIDGKPFLPHEHTGVQTGGGTSGPVA